MGGGAERISRSRCFEAPASSPHEAPCGLEKWNRTLNFSALQLSEPIVRAVTAKGYVSPTEIQAGAIPPALEGRDVLGTAQTGTGKTCAFALPILHRLAKAKGPATPTPRRHDRRDRGRAKGRAPRALILCPTRELATQIHESFMSYGGGLKLGYTVVYGGVSQYHQVRSLQRGVDVLVATPGRLKDLCDQGHIDLSSIETLVLDEADRMLDMGFITDIRRIVKMIPGDRQTLLFSATISKTIRTLADDLMNEPVVVETAPEATTVDAINQRFFMVPQQKKLRLLITLLNSENIGRVLVFTKTKHKADRVARWLQRAGNPADAIHSNKTQSARNKAMNAFKHGDLQVLVATDIASRGIDVDNITHVLNFDVPIDPETYVHRIGRTARAGATGTAITFFQANEKQMLRAIERRADIQLPPAEELPPLEDMPELASDEHTEDRSRDDRRRSPRRDGRDSHRGDRKHRSRKQSDSSNRNGYTSRDERDGDSGKSGGYKKDKFKKNAGGYSKGGYAPRDERDGDSGKSGGYKKNKFKKNAGGYSKGGYAPRDERDGDSTKSGGHKKNKFKKNTGGYNKGGYAPRDERDGDSTKSGGHKKNKFKKNAGGYSKGGYAPRDERDGDSGKPGGFKKKYKKKFKKNAGGYASDGGDTGKTGGHKKKFKKNGFKKAGIKKSGMSGGSKGHRKGQSKKKFATAK
ncbi:MAG: DEAD/DEAH box helicase [Phycisphaerae bacterium]|nr:DEAD/DEAH box helicase [Phycisphaerae bacterium]